MPIDDSPVILCYGDSNTWGHNPNHDPEDTVSESRYPYSIRWPGVLQSLSRDLRVLEEGLNGRTFACDDPEVTWLPPNPLEAVNGR